ncbi:MAG: DUF1553 domain-containing protein, partial [Lentisphaeraceae bacterium]|nr:DUF1553 domain-containing protein [Lentisphaeraceae bacterium]
NGDLPNMTLRLFSSILASFFFINCTFATEGIQFYQDKIKPIFEANCTKCHGEKKQKGGLRLDSVEGILAGGETEKLFVAGQPGSSFIIEAVNRTDEDMAMPPKNALPQKEIDLLTTWIRMGAPMPKPKGKVQLKSEYNWEELTKFWSFQKPIKPDEKSIDQLINNKLKEMKLSPVAKATKLELIRRATFDLTGLPPTPEDIDQFMADTSDNAFESVINKLLDSDHFGERWGRYWQDIVRYGDDQPYAFAQKPLSYAWKYRDWIVSALNKDLPYDEFIRRQVAADLIPNLPPEEHAATGLISTGPMYFKRTEVLKALADETDDRIDVLSKGFLGLTVACARCHNHKFDPIPTEDYYALAGVFKSTRIYDRFITSDEKIEEYHKRVFQKEILENSLHELTIKNAKTKIDQLTRTLEAASVAVTKGPLADEKYLKLNLYPKDVKKWTSILNSENAGKHPLITKISKAVLSHGEGNEFIELDDRSAKKSTGWVESKYFKDFIGKGYLHDDGNGKGKKTITFTLPVSKNSKYELFLAYNSNSARAKNVPIEIYHADGITKVSIDQSKQPDYKKVYKSLGLYSFNNLKPAKVVISNEGTQGYVIVDAIRMVAHGMSTEPDKSTVKKHINILTQEVYKTYERIMAGNTPTPVFSTPLVNSKSYDHRAKIDVNIKGWKKLYLVVENKAKNDYKFHFNAWMKPTFHAKKQQQALTDLEPFYVDTDGKLYGAKYVTNEDAIICNGEVLTHGIQHSGTTVLAYNIPAGTDWQRFTAEGGIFNKNGGEEGKNGARFHVFKEDPTKWLKRAELIEKFNKLTNNQYINKKASVDHYSEQDLATYKALTNKLKNEAPRRPNFVHGLWEDKPRNAKVNVRGNPKKLGDEVPRGYLKILNKGKDIQFQNGSGRLELANLIASKDNPLTARVMANRIWFNLFGSGIVNSPSNFGMLGDKPTNQPLLDWLAVDFMENNWSVKTLIKNIMLSETYQRSSQSSKANETIDEDNQYFWRQNMKRLDAESLRDSILAASGKLKTDIGGPGFNTRYDNSSYNRRTIYARVSRTAPDPMRLTFDFPSPSNSSPKRNVTTVPQQRLFYLNSEFIMEQANVMTYRVLTHSKSPEARMDYMFKIAYGRSPDAQESNKLLPFFKSGKNLEAIAQALLVSNEFSYID